MGNCMRGRGWLRWGGSVGALCALCALQCGSALAQASQAQPVCRARQVEIYQEGGDAGLGSGRQIVGLRNASPHSCTLFAIPRLEFFDAAGKRLTIPYGKNQAAMMFEQQPERLVTLQPGEFAHFMLGTSTGDQRFRYHTMRALLPGDEMPLAVGAPADYPFDSIDVSAVVAGIEAEDGFVLPGRRIAATGGSLSGLALTLDVPAQPKGPFDAHFTLRNTGTAPLRIDGKQCSLSGRLTNSAGKIVWENEGCGAWAGEIGVGGLLRPGARATADISVGDVAMQLCREGPWNARFTLGIGAGTVEFAEFPFELVSAGCSDSEHVGDFVDEKTIRWTLVPQHGVRLGVAVRAKGDAVPAMSPIAVASPGLLAPEFHAGEPIELRLYLDDLSDAPLQWRSGSDAFRVVVRVWGHSDMLVPLRPVPDGEGDMQATVLPHTWRSVQTMELNDLFDLAPDSYDVTIGPRTLMRGAAAANAPATGWVAAEGSATTGTFVKIVP